MCGPPSNGPEKQPDERASIASGGRELPDANAFATKGSGGLSMQACFGL
jgi:hypothetical protein